MPGPGQELIKTSIGELALFGGVAAFSEPLHVGRPNLGDRTALHRRIDGILDRAWLTNDGPLVQELEKHVAAIAGVEHCIATCNATLALEIAARSTGLTGEVILPSFTFVATAHAMTLAGLEPVFCDIDPVTHQLDVADVKRRITPRTSAILPVHVWGHPSPVEELESLARSHGLRLLFDSAHAFASSYRGRPIGSFGDAEIFSFHATKFVNSAEGGAIVTNDGELADKARLLRNFGFSNYDSIESLGMNAKMSELSAAMGLTTLERMDEFIRVNERNIRLYKRELANVSGIRILENDPRDDCNYQYVVIEIDSAETGLDRDALKDVLWAENVLARRYFYPGCHRVPPYADRAERLEHTEAVTQRVLSLPNGTSVSAEAVEQVCAIIRTAIENGPAITQKLAR